MAHPFGRPGSHQNDPWHDDGTPASLLTRIVAQGSAIGFVLILLLGIYLALGGRLPCE
ncbi:hypothetical protein [Microcystis phage Mwe-Yong1]|nr:hypothetical protein [Microcystis phage Mwe-Yong1]